MRCERLTDAEQWSELLPAEDVETIPLTKAFDAVARVTSVGSVGLVRATLSPVHVVSADVGAIELGFLEEGAVSFRDYGRSCEVRPNLPHIQDVNRGWDATAHIRSHISILYFPRPLVHRLGETWGYDESALRDTMPCWLDFETPQGRALQAWAHHAWAVAEVGGPSPLASELVEPLVRALLGAAGVPRAPEKRGPSPRDPQIFERAAAFVFDNLERPLRVSEIAADVGVSVRTLHRAFVSQLGVSPKTFLTEQRLERARTRLLGARPGETQVTDVATTLGFYHLGQFAVEYRKRFGETPSASLAL